MIAEAARRCGLPSIAPVDAKPVGAWTIIKRKDGAGQWAYQGFPVYTSVLDTMPGDAYGGYGRGGRGGDAGPPREVVGPSLKVPAQLKIVHVATADVMLRDRCPCDGLCVGQRQTRINRIAMPTCLPSRGHPVLAPATASQPQGD